MTMLQDERSGACLCGAVRFRATRVKSGFAGCHCRMCQRWAGAVLLAASVPADAVEFTGRENIGIYQSSAWAERAWCTRCGSGLWYRPTVSPEADYEIPVGLFDDASGLTMTHEIFIDRKPDAYAFAGDHRRETEAEVLSRYNLQEGEPQ